jgi:hypothetical protein
MRFHLATLKADLEDALAARSAARDDFAAASARVGSGAGADETEALRDALVRLDAATLAALKADNTLRRREADNALDAAREAGEADNAATFEQAFGALIVAIDRANFHDGDELRRLDALAYAFDKLPAVEPDRTADLLLKTEALAALVLFAAEELRASDERYLLTDRLDLELTASWRARDALTLALARLTALDGGRERP